MTRIREGMRLQGVIVETCLDPGLSRIRVRPIPGQVVPTNMRVEFPRDLREGVPIGTRYEVSGVVAQKHNKDGSPRGPEYFVARQSARRLAPGAEDSS